MTTPTPTNTTSLDPGATRIINLADLPMRDAYRLATSIVAPRPVAWVSTRGMDGSLNLAPYSFFNIVSGDPITVMISIGARKNGPKDTLRNIQETGEFVVNIADNALLTMLNQSSAEFPYEVDEFAFSGAEPAPSTQVQVPRVLQAPVAMEARLTQVVPIVGSTNTMVLGRVLVIHLRDGLLRPNGLVDALQLDPVTRLGGDEYGVLGRITPLARPVV
jgi:flavin reductase (DIM6/NTAB) family NADH-FMN oxidoreductase RutF